jgi:hypothetical protein
MSRPEEQEELRALLRDTAAGWEPDRTKMINRVAAGRSAAARPRSRAWSLRPVAAAASVVVISVLSVVAVRSVNSSAQTDDAPPAAQAPIAVTGSPSPSASRATPASSPATPATTAKPHTSAPAGQHQGPQTVTAKSAIGKDSVATWSECTVTVTNPKTVDALTVSIKVALSAQAADAGKYTTVPNSDVTMTVTKDADAMTYTWVLNGNARLIPGSYVFAAQFTHTGGRTWSKDGYQVRAGPTALTGGFG